MKKVAIQGITGSYHDIAAHHYFEGEDIEPVACGHFKDVVAAIKKDDKTFGLMAIENTIAGSLLQNYELIRTGDLKIIGEYKLRISHSLVCLPGETIDDIVEINSHPIALMQCSDFLSKYPDVKIVEKDDTASAAREIAEKHLKGHAAICGKYAAGIYGMKILEEGIETNKRNFTRFLALANKWHDDKPVPPHTSNKASVVFALPHTSGSLSQVLSILSFYGINLTKIQSLPIIGKEWEYLFYIDLTYTDYMRYRQSLDAITPLTKDFKILGEYEEGKQSM
jgi:prephenate dehydratase